MKNLKPQTLKPRTALLCDLCFLCVLYAFLPFSGCEKSSAPPVVLYTSIDQPIAAPIIRKFEKQTGIRVTLVTDSEASKTVGLAERLRAEKSNPQADVYWGNEPFHTINLAEEGVLEPYDSAATRAAAQEMPARYVDEQNLWHCNALRARVIVTSAGMEPVDSIARLTDPSLKRSVAMARPTAGTTGGHVAALYKLWGEQRADEFFRALRANEIKLIGGNAVVAELVGNGTVKAGLTDNDDAAATTREGGKLAMVLPDQNSFGTLPIPTTIALVAGAKNRDAAGKLIDCLVSIEVENQLIEAKFAGWSIRADVEAEIKAMDVDYREVARSMPQAVRRATAILEGRE